ncbi:MAG: leucine-rich repeat protein [Pseudomonadota bacterium]|nr:leucine-rich repeat protein [Pseudomonadota bacterium]
MSFSFPFRSKGSNSSSEGDVADSSSATETRSSQYQVSLVPPIETLDKVQPEDKVYLSVTEALDFIENCSSDRVNSGLDDVVKNLFARVRAEERQEFITSVSRRNSLSMNVRLSFFCYYIKAYFLVQGRDSAVNVPENLLDNVQRPEEKQQFICAVGDMDSLPVDERVSFFRLVDGITSVKEAMIPVGVGDAIKCLKIPDSLLFVEENAFKNCSGLTEISLPADLKMICKDAFKGCTALEKIVVPLSFIGKDDCYWESVGKPNTTKVVCSDALYNALDKASDYNLIIDELNKKENVSLSSIDALIYLKTFHERQENEYLTQFANALLEKLEDADERQQFISAFCSMDSLPVDKRVSFFQLVDGITKVTSDMIPQSIRCLIKGIDFPESLQAVGPSAFNSCTQLEKFVVPLALMSKNTEYWESKGLSDCSIIQCSDAMYEQVKSGKQKMKDLINTFNQKKPGNLSLNEALIYIKACDVRKSKRDVVSFAENLLGKLESPQEKQQFISAVSGMESLPMANKVSFFRLVEGITKVTADTVPESIRKKMKKVVFPESLKEIDYEAFSGCSGLSKILVPFSCMQFSDEDWGARGIDINKKKDMVKCSDTLYNLIRDKKSTRELLVSNINSLTPPLLSVADALVYMKALTNNIGKNKNIREDDAINVANALLDKLENVDEKQQFITAVSDMQSLSMAKRVSFFSLVEGITKVTSDMVPMSIRPSIDKIDFPKSLEEIDADAFKDCKLLNVISLPARLKKIGKNAFFNCFIQFVSAPVSFTSVSWAEVGLHSLMSDFVEYNDPLFKMIKNRGSYESLITKLATYNTLSSHDALVYIESFCSDKIKQPHDDVIKLFDALYKKLDSVDEQQKFISGFCRISDYDVSSRLNRFKLLPDITQVKQGMIPRDDAFCRRFKTLNIPEKVNSIDENAFESLRSLEEITVPLSFMGKDRAYWLSRGLPSRVKVSCDDKLYNAFNKCSALNDIKSMLTDVSQTIDQETIGIYLKCLARNGFYSDDEIVKFAKLMVGSNDTEMLRDHLLYLYRNNHLDLLKCYQKNFGKQEVASLLSSVVGEDAKKLNEMVGGVSDHATHRYLYINPEIETGQDSFNVTFLMPFAGGAHGIISDNTCKTTTEMLYALKGSDTTKQGGLEEEITGYIGKIDKFIFDLNTLEGEGAALILQLEKIKEECRGFLNEYRSKGTPMCALKEELVGALGGSFGINTQASFPEPLNQHLRGNNNLYGAVFSVEDRNKKKGGTYLVDNYFRTKTLQSDPKQPTAVCSFSRETYRNARGVFVKSGTVSPFAKAVAEAMQSIPSVKHEKLLDKVLRMVRDRMDSQSENDDGLISLFRIMLNKEIQELRKQQDSINKKIQRIVSLEEKEPWGMNDFTLLYGYQDGVRKYVEYRNKTREIEKDEKKAMIDKAEPMLAHERKILQQNQQKLGIYAFANSGENSVMLNRLELCDPKLFKRMRESLCGFQAVQSVFRQLYPEIAKEKRWEEVLKNDHVDLDDISNILNTLVTDWDDFEQTYGAGAPAPFYDAMEKTDKKLGLKNANQLALFSQIAIARVNVMARSKDLSTENFGVILDGNKELRDKFCTVLAEVMKESRDVEDVILKFINDHYATFGMSRQLDQEESAYCAEQIKVQINILKSSPHMDEHFFLGDKVSKPEEGIAPETVQYGGLVSMPVVGLLREDQRNASHEAQLASFRKLKMDGSTLNVSQSLTFTKMLDAHPNLKSAILQRKISSILNNKDETFKNLFLKMVRFSPEKAHEIVDVVNNLSKDNKIKFLDDFIWNQRSEISAVLSKREREQKAVNTLQHDDRGFSLGQKRLDDFKQHKRF